MNKGKFTRQEILSQPEAWAAALEALEETRRSVLDLAPARRYGQILFTGCGSTYYLSLAAAALFQELTGLPGRAFPASELWLNPRSSYGQAESLTYKTLLVAVSRSGATTETLRAVEQFRQEKRGEVIVITNDGDQPLAQLADLPIVIEKGQEQSVAQTRSFASMYVAAAGLCALSARRDNLLEIMSALPEVGQRLLRDYEPAARELGANLAFDRFYFLGSGIRYGLACEVNLKMKEMTLTHSEPFHFMEFRHGPMSMVNRNTVVAGLVSEANHAHETKVLVEMEELGATTFSLAETGATVEFRSGVPEIVRGVLYLPVLQLTAYHRAIAKGLDPDRPNNLSAVVKLE